VVQSATLPSGLATVSLPVTRTAAMSLDGKPVERKLVPAGPEGPGGSRDGARLGPKREAAGFPAASRFVASVEATWG